MELDEFLLARIAEDEEVALSASPGPWHLNAERTEVIAVDDIQVAEAFALSSNQLRATATHIALHDPARVLAECDAKRALVLLHQPDSISDPLRNAKQLNPAAWKLIRPLIEQSDEEHEATLRLLALPYADHPDYRAEWRP